MIVSGCIALAIGTWRTNAGMVPGGRSAACISTLRPAVLTPAFFSTSDMRAPVKRAVPTAPFSHWMPATAGSKERAAVAGAFERHRDGHRRELLDLVERERERRVHLAADLQATSVAASTCGTGMCERT